MYKPNLKLLQNHDGFDEWSRKNKITVPFCLSFKREKKIFNYIGVQHTTDKNSDVFKLITKTIKKYKPQMIILEGIENKLGVNPILNNFGGEGYHAASEGNKYGSSFIGVEGSESKIIRALKKEFDPVDIMGFLFLRMHKIFFKMMKAPSHDFLRAFYENEIKHYKKIFKVSDFNHKLWFFKTFKKQFRYGSFLEYASPVRGEILTQKISCAYSRIRDTINIKNVYKLINKYNNVLYIMGKNHVYADIGILTETFGKHDVKYL